MWLLNARHQSIPVPGTIFKVKALYFAKELGCDSFQAPNGWLDRRKNRYNVSFKAISGSVLGLNNVKNQENFE